MPSETDPASTLDFHVRAKERQLRNALGREDEVARELKRALAERDRSASDALSEPTIDALYTQLALLDLPTAAATELLPPDDLRTRGLLSDALGNLKTAGRRLFHAYSEALHTFVCEKAGADLRGQVLSAISAGTGISVVTAAFVSIGVSTAVAPVAAMLLLTILVRPTVAEVCKMWAESLADIEKKVTT